MGSFKSNMYTLRSQRPTTVIYIQVKRFKDTYFILCDEYDLVEDLKGKILNQLEMTGFEMERQEEPLTTADLELRMQKRVLDSSASCHDQQVFNNAVLYLCIKKADGQFGAITDVAMG